MRSLPRWRSAKSALLYMPIRNEIDLRPLLVECFNRGMTTLLPRCRPAEPGVMDLACVASHDDICAIGPFGIQEPGDHCALAPEPPDVAIVPGAAFDRQGFRLGYGGGYFDRLLARPEWAHCLAVGVCHGFQLVPELPHDPWDRPVNIVCSSGGICRP